MTEVTLIILKPDALQLQLEDDFLKRISGVGLTILHKKELTLTEKQIMGYQPAFNRHDTVRGETWKEKAIKFHTTFPSKVFLIEGNNAVSKGLEIKKQFRSDFLKPEENNPDYKSVYNLIHCIDDIDDLLLNISILVPECRDIFDNIDKMFNKRSEEHATTKRQEKKYDCKKKY